MPVPADFFKSTTAHVNLDSRYIKAQVQFYKKLISDEFPQTIKIKYEDRSKAAELRTIVFKIILQLVYEVYEPKKYRRSYRLLTSFEVGHEGDATEGSLVVFSNPNVAPVKIDRGVPDLSYAVFFLEPERFRTFIPPRGEKETPVNYRPFFQVLLKVVNKFNNKHARQSVLDAIDELMPVILKGKE